MRPDEESELDLGGLLRMLWSYKYVIAGTVTLCGIAAVVLALTTTPVYRAETVVTDVSDEKMGGVGALASQFGGLASLAGVNLTSGNAGKESKAFLRSNKVVEEFISRRNLLSELFPDAKRPPTLWRGVRKFQDGLLSIREDTRRGTTTVAI